MQSSVPEPGPCHACEAEPITPLPIQAPAGCPPTVEKWGWGAGTEPRPASGRLHLTVRPAGLGPWAGAAGRGFQANLPEADRPGRESQRCPEQWEAKPDGGKPEAPRWPETGKRVTEGHPPETHGLLCGRRGLQRETALRTATAAGGRGRARCRPCWVHGPRLVLSESGPFVVTNGHKQERKPSLLGEGCGEEAAETGKTQGRVGGPPHSGSGRPLLSQQGRPWALGSVTPAPRALPGDRRQTPAGTVTTAVGT